MKKRIALLGATGSIGTQTLDVASQHEEIEVVSMSCRADIDAFEPLVRKFRPQMVSVFDETAAKSLKGRLEDTSIRVVSGMGGMLESVTLPEADVVVSGISGMIGIEPTLAAIDAGKDIALANKETLVTAGDLVMERVRNAGVKMIPVDSEHSAIYQCLHGRRPEEVEKLLLTASGGPFRTWTKEAMRDVTPEMALKHPNWAMGPKITIDSASMMNKGLEIIEAAKLFDVPSEKIEVVVHPQSIVHSMVQFIDGGVMAQLGTSSMTLPIQYAVFDGVRKDLNVRRVDFFELGRLTFERPNPEVFEALALARRALETGGTLPAVLNAANEIAVARFLKKEIGFLDIIETVASVMDRHTVKQKPSLEEIFETIAWVKEELGVRV